MKKARSFLTIAIVIAVFFLLSTTTVKAQNITLTISGIKSNNGQIIVSVFKDNETFKNEKAAFNMMMTHFLHYGQWTEHYKKSRDKSVLNTI